MKTKFPIRLICLLILLLLIAPTVPAWGQAAPDAGAFDPQKFEEQARDLLQQVQRPDTDPQQVMQQFRDLMRQFRDETANMSPEQADQIRQRLMQNLGPLMAQAMPTIMRRMEEARLNELKGELELSDEEFAVIKPAIQKVMDAQRAVAVAGMRRGPGGPGGGPGGPPPGVPGASAPLATAMGALRETLLDPNAKPDAIKARLDAVRQAKSQAEHDVAVAQAELRPLLTIRQESVLVSYGLLD
ncbi:MAG TPA: hypothetical protein VGI81_05710 [Tepidisphaeraceae bacterium]|jgi:hypothetical protein